MDIPHGAKVALYLRCSQVEQEYSIEDQRSLIEQELVRERGLEVVAEYVDEGEPGGAIETRPELLRLLDDAKKGLFDYVVVYDVSRLTRGGMGAFGWLFHELRKCRVLLYTMDSHRLVTEEDADRFARMASQALEENKKRSRDVIRSAVRDVAERGHDPGRRPPLGYDRVHITPEGEVYQRIRILRDGRKQVLEADGITVRVELSKGEKAGKIRSHRPQLVPGHPDDVALAQRIFNLGESMSANRIADTLNTEGALSPTGKPWSASSITAILTNPAYAGVRVYNRRHECKYNLIRHGRATPVDHLDEGDVNLGDNPESEWVIVEDAHEALVTKEQYENVQEAIEQRCTSPHGSPRSKRYAYLLSGLAVCSRCGSPLVGHTRTASKAKGGRAYPSYTCSGAKKHGKSHCGHYSLPAPRIEGFIMAVMRSTLAAPEALKAVRQGLERQVAMAASPPDLSAIRKEGAALDEKKRALFEKLTPEQIAFFQPQIEELEREERLLKTREEAAKAAQNLADPATVIDKAMAAYKRLIESLEGGGHEALRNVLQALGLQIHFDPDTKEGYLNFDPFVQHVSE